jgi:hypothetical protein
MRLGGRHRRRGQPMCQPGVRSTARVGACRLSSTVANRACRSHRRVKPSSGPGSDKIRARESAGSARGWARIIRPADADCQARTDHGSAPRANESLTIVQHSVIERQPSLADGHGARNRPDRSSRVLAGAGHRRTRTGARSGRPIPDTGANDCRSGRLRRVPRQRSATCCHRCRAAGRRPRARMRPRRASPAAGSEDDSSEPGRRCTEAYGGAP